MLHVLTMCTGDKYSPEYVVRLLRAVNRHLSESFSFECITETEYPGWWGKVELFKRQGRFLWLDLDVVITGSLDDLVQGSQPEGSIRCAKNWAQSGYGGCQSSVMFWESAPQIYDLFNPKDIHWPPSNANGALWGDQEWLTVLRDSDRLNVDYFEPELIKSYKYHCREGVPAGCSVVAFHGKPDPHEVSDKWVSESWK